jgi:hypothetical protein
VLEPSLAIAKTDFDVIFVAKVSATGVIWKSKCRVEILDCVFVEAENALKTSALNVL